MELKDIVFLIILSIVIIGIYWAYRSEKKEWNGGYCNKCWNKWVHFDTDSQGGLGWTCKCGRYIWTSYIGGHKCD